MLDIVTAADRFAPVGDCRPAQQLAGLRFTIGDVMSNNVDTGNEDANRILRLVFERAERMPEPVKSDAWAGVVSLFFPFAYLRSELDLGDDELLEPLYWLHENRFLQIALRGTGITVWLRCRYLDSGA